MAVVPPYVGGTWPKVHYPLRGRFKFTFKVQVPGFPGRLATLCKEWRSRNLFVATPTGYWLNRRSLSTRELPEK